MGERHGDSMGRRLLSLSEGPEGRGEGERGEGGGTGGLMVERESSVVVGPEWWLEVDCVR